MWGQFLQFYESSGLDGVGLNGGKQTEINCTRITLKVIPPILWCWHMTSEADVGDTAVEAETSYQYSITCCCCMTDGSRGASWHNGAWHGSAYEAKVCHWIPPCGKNGTHWHSLTLVERWWRPKTGCEYNEVVVHSNSGYSDNGSPLLVQIVMSTTCTLSFIAGKNAYLMVVIMLKNSAL